MESIASASPLWLHGLLDQMATFTPSPPYFTCTSQLLPLDFLTRKVSPNHIKQITLNSRYLAHLLLLLFSFSRPLFTLLPLLLLSPMSVSNFLTASFPLFHLSFDSFSHTSHSSIQHAMILQGPDSWENEYNFRPPRPLSMSAAVVKSMIVRRGNSHH